LLIGRVAEAGIIGYSTLSSLPLDVPKDDQQRARASRNYPRCGIKLSARLLGHHERCAVKEVVYQGRFLTRSNLVVLLQTRLAD
jgi:hypothetical protein